MTLKRLWVLGLVLTACVLVVGSEHKNRNGQKLKAGERDEYGRLTNLRFLHIPKTGTSFIVTLRNYLTFCERKDISCDGWQGGSHNPLERSIPTPYQEQVCHRRLIACQGNTFHLPWTLGLDAEEYNTVTLLRNPLSLFRSGFRFTNALREREGELRYTVKGYLKIHSNIMTKMLTGTLFNAEVDNDQWEMRLESAKRVLVEKVAFWGISDHWNATVCTFHKELNGPGPRPTEYVNTRPSSALFKNDRQFTLEELALEKKRNAYDYKLFAWALPLFKERAQKVGCWED